jgi:hypothetical protein
VKKIGGGITIDFLKESKKKSRPIIDRKPDGNLLNILTPSEDILFNPTHYLRQADANSCSNIAGKYSEYFIYIPEWNLAAVPLFNYEGCPYQPGDNGDAQTQDAQGNGQLHPGRQIVDHLSEW